MPPHLTGARLRERRLALGLRQGEVAAQAAISASYLNLIEHNRRKVTPDVLERLAAALGLEAAAFSDRAPGHLTQDLRAAAAALPAAAAELDRIEELVSRLPGWAALVTEQHRRSSTLEGAVATLNDRLGHDPHLSAALHELLSALSGVRATAEILAQTEDLSAEWQQRFHRNLHQDSERLAHGAEALVSYLDRSDAAQPFGPVSAQDEVETWRAGRGWHLAAAEADDAMHHTQPEGANDTGAYGLSAELSAELSVELSAELAALGSDAARSLAMRQIMVARDDAARMPLAAFRLAVARHNGDPGLIAAEFGVGIIASMRRIASLPGAPEGLVICDGSGTILLRKPVAGFTVPRFGAACPLWPLFQALGRPGLTISSHVVTPEEDGFATQAFCEVQHPFGFGGVELRMAAMLIRPVSVPAPAAIPLGSTCRICAREPCPARREPSILSAMTTGDDLTVKRAAAIFD